MAGRFKGHFADFVLAFPPLSMADRNGREHAGTSEITIEDSPDIARGMSGDARDFGPKK